MKLKINLNSANQKYFKIAYLLIFVTVFLSCSTKNKKLENTTVSFKKEIYDFGVIPLKKEASTSFVFLNTGEQPLFIQNVKSTCGCTVPEYPKEMIKSNKKGEIKVVYDAKLPGRFNKTITVFYNGKNSPKKLIIKGEVSYPELKKDKGVEN